GEDLATRLSAKGAVTVGEAVVWGEQIASALAAVHSAGLVHRDLKPANIFLAKRGTWRGIKLLDFGVAKQTDDDAQGEDAARTQSGVILGTPFFMAPEQARGHDVDARTDIYAMGLVLYVMLCGEAPFAGRTLADQVLHQETQTPAPPGQV